MNRITVGIPTYGECSFLAQTIESVLAQTVSNWTLRVCDDGNGDARDVVGRYLVDPRVSYVANHSRLGAAGNWSKIVQEADGEAVAVLSQDDLWEPAFLERRLEFLDRHRECGFVYGPHVDVDERGNEIRRAPVALSQGVHQPLAFVPRLLRDPDVRPSPPSILVRRAAYTRVGARFDERFVVFDLEMWLRIGLELPVGYLAEHDSSYRVHAEQLSRRVAWGRQWLEFERHAERLLAERLPGAQLPPAERAARRARGYVSAAMDELAEGSRRDALRLLAAAVGERRRSLLDLRLVAALAVAPFGRRGGSMLGRVRWWFARRGVRLPFHDRH
jgi:glycosyltransferase involved in cell wall biosynthesis